MLFKMIFFYDYRASILYIINFVLDTQLSSISVSNFRKSHSVDFVINNAPVFLSNYH